ACEIVVGGARGDRVVQDEMRLIRLVGFDVALDLRLRIATLVRTQWRIWLIELLIAAAAMMRGRRGNRHARGHDDYYAVMPFMDALRRARHREAVNPIGDRQLRIGPQPVRQVCER